MLGAYSYSRFLQEYISEGRSVWSQKLNLTTTEKERLFLLINENLRPENVKYRYDFFYDNCATRVRDIIAASADDTVIFPVKEKSFSFRQLIDPTRRCFRGWILAPTCCSDCRLTEKPQWLMRCSCPYC
ncbi:MAG: DUF4105 domain-containing protein [Bacteroidales bacterium]|nr:DUF4105 domain-containing protein [Bacteroidales bacterium]